jgi:hypothetical protein
LSLPSAVIPKYLEALNAAARKWRWRKLQASTADGSDGAFCH